MNASELIHRDCTAGSVLAKTDFDLDLSAIKTYPGSASAMISTECVATTDCANRRLISRNTLR